MSFRRRMSVLFNSNLISKFLSILIICLILIDNVSCDNSIIKEQTIPKFSPSECGSIDIRYYCHNLKKLENCTVINGYLMMVLMSRPCPYQNLTFPLREITDYLIFYDMRGLTSIKDIFPNLTVIRGRRLFLNYALGVSRMPSMERLEFRSLIAIQRGHVFVGRNRKLCSLGKIFWDRLTLSPGENHIFLDNGIECPPEPTCLGCPIDYCWSNFTCQKFENDNVIYANQGIQHCHRECLGGCYNSSNTGCAVCRHLTDHGACVSECPPDKYLVEHYQRCYTRDECNAMGRFVYKRTCLRECPTGYKSDTKNNDPSLRGSCVECSKNDTCIKVCQTEDKTYMTTIFNLANAEQLKGCHFLNGSLVVSIRNKVDEAELEKALSSLTEIQGHVKIYRSEYITSLRFLKGLKRIAGQPLESNTYGLILYDNPNLRDFWEPVAVVLERGGMYIHLNNKLCTKKIKDFSRRVKHDMSLDSIQVSDKDVFCFASKILLEIEVLSHSQFRFSWPIEDTSDEVEILYYMLPYNMKYLPEENEIDSNVCSAQIWKKELLFETNFESNGTHYSYILDDLPASTTYACYIKTFGQNDTKNARSDIMYVTTKMDLPKQPSLELLSRTNTSLTIELKASAGTFQIIDHYEIYLHEHPDDVELLDKRNFCEEPILFFENIPFPNYNKPRFHEDYEECCLRKEEMRKDNLFKAQIRDTFACSVDQPGYCSEDEDEEFLMKEATIPPIDLKANDTTIYTFENLTNYRMYGIEVKACNNLGCGSYAMLYERTNFSEENDLVVDLKGCRVPNTYEYHIHFNEPKQPNGAIISYGVHYQTNLTDDKTVTCVTRVDHASNNFMHIERLSMIYDMVAVRVHSLANEVLSPWVSISICGKDGENSGIDTARTKMAGYGETRSSGNFNIFLIFFLIGAGCTLLWVCYKRRLWRKLPELQRYIPSNCNCLSLLKRPTQTSDDDREILVDGFEVIRFSNSIEDEL